MKVKVKNLRKWVEDELDLVLPFWQRTYKWNLELMMKLLETIRLSETKDLDIDAVEVCQLQDRTTRISTSKINYKIPEQDKTHDNCGLFSGLMNLLQDGQQRLTALMCMCFGEYVKIGPAVWRFYWNSTGEMLPIRDVKKGDFSQFLTLAKGGSLQKYYKDRHSGSFSILFSKVVEMYLSADGSFDGFKEELKQYLSMDIVPEYEKNWYAPIKYILEYDLEYKLKKYDTILDAMDAFDRKNSGMALNKWYQFVNKLSIIHPTVQNFDQLFNDARNKVNIELETYIQNYYAPKEKGRRDFALHLMSYLKRRTFSSVGDDKIDEDLLRQITPKAIDDFSRKIIILNRKIANTKIVLSDKYEWETYLPYRVIFSDLRFSVLPLLYRMHEIENQPVGRRNIIPDSFVKYLIYQIAHRDANTRDHFAERVLSNRDSIDTEMRIQNSEVDEKGIIHLCASNLQNKSSVEEHSLIPGACAQGNFIKKNPYNLVYVDKESGRKNKLPVDTYSDNDEELRMIEAIPARYKNLVNEMQQEVFLKTRRNIVEKRFQQLCNRIGIIYVP